MQTSETVISEINVVPVKPRDGLVAFASLVLNGSLFLGSIAVHKRLDGSGYRLTYPTKKIGDSNLHIFHPINRELGQIIEEEVAKKLGELGLEPI